MRLKEAAIGKPYHLKFCTAKFKDAGQLRNRFKRRGQATLRPYEVLSDDDTVLFGAIPTSLEDAQDDMTELKDELGVAELLDGVLRWAVGIGTLGVRLHPLCLDGKCFLGRREVFGRIYPRL